MPTLSDFLDQLLVTKHGEALTDESKKEMKADLLPRLERWITVKTMEEIVKKSPDDVNVFITMLEEKKSMEDIQKFVDARLPDYPSRLAAILMEFQSLYLGANQALPAQ